jgi:plastocyanin
MTRLRSLRVALAAAVAGGALLALAAPAMGDTAIIRMRDRCDPATFNAVLGEGACVGREGKNNVTFAELISTLSTEGRHLGWRFKPRTTVVTAGDLVKVRNIGGEVHTFTRVQRFGGGFVEELNELLELEQVPECVPIPSRSNRFVEAGGVTFFRTGRGSVVPVGTTHWECCIHPWMKASIEVHAH